MMDQQNGFQSFSTIAFKYILHEYIIVFHLNCSTGCKGSSVENLDGNIQGFFVQILFAYHQVAVIQFYVNSPIIVFTASPHQVITGSCVTVLCILF